jgi:hypothetical protein
MRPVAVIYRALRRRSSYRGRLAVALYRALCRAARRADAYGRTAPLTVEAEWLVDRLAVTLRRATEERLARRDDRLRRGAVGR